MQALRERTVEGIEADRARCRELLDRSTAVATALSPYIGYAATAEIAKESVAHRPSDSRDGARTRVDGGLRQLDRILSAEAMTQPGMPAAVDGPERMTRTHGQRGRIAAGQAPA